MSDSADYLKVLKQKLDHISKRQEDFSREIESLRSEISKLERASGLDQAGETAITKVFEEKNDAPVFEPVRKPGKTNLPPKAKAKPVRKSKLNRNFKESANRIALEKFIGENLINKIGIAVLIIGIGIGAKYTIENDLISPLTRIVLGYIAGLGLMVFGMKLKEKYESFSAVLVSGSMAVLYFITYMAYGYYQLIPQTISFVLMVVFTAFTVLSAINYNRQIIAHIGLVGAYAVPFLLSSGSGKVEILLTYMSVINIGILIIAFKKNWKPLNYVSFGLSWLILIAWIITDYKQSLHFGIAVTFTSVFFLTFYATSLAYKLIKNEKFKISDVVTLLINSFIFYALMAFFLEDNLSTRGYLGLFTLANAFIHFVVSVIIHKKKLGDRKLFFLVSGMVMVFIALAIPVQLDGNWVTLLWAAQAAMLFWLGRTTNVPTYEKLSYPLMLLAFGSLAQDWNYEYSSYTYIPNSSITPLWNIHFLSSMLVAIVFAFIIYLHRQKKFSSALQSGGTFHKVISYILPVIFISILYFGLRVEIVSYWDQILASSEISIIPEGENQSRILKNYDYRDMKIIWVLNFSLLFVSVLSFLNLYKFKKTEFGLENLGLNIVAIFVFLVQGLFVISELRESYISQNYAEFFHRGYFNIWIRYISFLFLAVLMIACYKYSKAAFIKWKNLKIPFDFLLHMTILWVGSSELLHWMDLYGTSGSYKLGLSILWGVYSLFLIALGIWKKNMPIRIGAMVLFAVTLIKLFFYDISHLNTISKTIVFVSLGVLLLVISFLYNKYKHLITDELES